MTPDEKANRYKQAAFAKLEALERAERRKKLRPWLAIVGIPLLGAAVGLLIGGFAAPPPPPGAWVDFNAIDYAFGGAAIGFLAGLVLGTIVALEMWRRRAAGR